MSTCAPTLAVCAATMRRGSVNDGAVSSESRAASTLSTPITPGNVTSERTFGSRSMLYCVPMSPRGRNHVETAGAKLTFVSIDRSRSKPVFAPNIDWR